MNKLLKWSLSLLLVSFFVACSEDTEEEVDCTVDVDGTVKIFYPKGGEVFHLGDEVTIKYGAKNSEGVGFRFVYFFDEESEGIDLTIESAGPEAPIGDRCYTEKVILGGEDFPTSDAAFIQVRDYSNASVGAFTKTFQVVE